MSAALETQARALLEQAGLVKASHTPAFKRVTPEEAAKIFRLRKEGLKLEDIASACGRSIETVHRHLELLSVDTTEDAGHVLKGSALEAALVLTDKMYSSVERVGLEASKAVLAANGLSGDSSAHVTVGVQVVLGMPDLREP